jgi:subtilisin-like proprotein convertase family protein
MLKALLLNSTRYMTGVAANDTLPSAAQGWGMANLGTLFDGTPRLLKDQATLFTASGQTYDLLGTVSDPGKPFRVTLAWTDAPGSTVGQAQVNDLDLEVTANGTVYHGNVFSGAYSVSGGTADALNNLESVFLPAGVDGGFRVRVVARNIAGDGVPGNGSPTDQDFALVVDNATASLSPVLSVTGVHWSEEISNGNGYIEPGETAFVDVDLQDLAGTPAALSPSATISVAGGQATILQGTSGYADILPGATQTNLARFQVLVLPSQPCGGDLTLAIHLAYTGGAASFPLPALSTSQPAFTKTYTYSGPAVNIPDGNANGVLIPLQVNDATAIQSMTVTLDITHPYVGDLALSLAAPGGQSVMLANRRGGSADNYANVTFADQAAQSITTAAPPFTGSYKPESPLAAFNQTSAYGTWNLKAADFIPIDVGTLNSYSLAFQFKICYPVVWPYRYFDPFTVKP